MPEDVESCLPLVSILTGNLHRLGRAVSGLQETWPSLRLLTPRFLFDESDYYKEEMGTPLFRWWAYRSVLADPSELVQWKTTTVDLEDDLRGNDGNRTVNLDPGYVDLGLVVLGSHKNHHQKIYLGNGVYADPVLEYVNGGYRPFHWSFPDFQDERYYATLEFMRERFKQLRTRKK